DPRVGRPAVSPEFEPTIHQRLAKSRTMTQRAHASEQAFRILLKFLGNVPCNLMFYPRSIEEDWNEEAWIRYRCTWCDHHRGAVDCERRDRRDQAWRLSRPSSWLWRACRISARPRLASRMAWLSRPRGGHQEASLLRPTPATEDA